MRAVILFLTLVPDGGRFFDRRDVDFWGTRARPEPPEDLWEDSKAPGPVRRLLDDPTRENAEAYHAWQQERLRRLRAAVAAVEEVRRAPILYFGRADCRACERQEEELRELPFRRVPAGSPLWQEYGVTVTPTLVVRDRVFRGLTRRQTLVEEMTRE